MTATADGLPLTEIIKMIPGYDPYDDTYDPETGEQVYYFDEEKAQEAIDFFPDYLTFTKGEWMGRPFTLGPWQKAVVANTFGWRKVKDGTRRYREIFFYVPRKNGKTELIGGIGNYVFFCDGEPGAECYCAASNEDQALIVWNVARQMIEQNPELDECVRIYKKSITMDTMGSFFKPITADAKSKHGFSVHLALYDELHAVGSAELAETIETGTGSRREPLIIYMTTADEDRVSVCNSKYDYACKVRDRIFVDPEFLPIIYELRKDEDWHDPENWKKANPNWGVSVKEDDFKRQYLKAKNEPSFRPNFRRLKLNTVTQRASKWIDMGKWDECGHEYTEEFMEGLLNQECFGALDLSSTIDTTALSLFFPKFNCLLQWFWIPEDTASERSKVDKVPYLTWKEQGFLETTPGNRIDNSYIESRILEIQARYDLKIMAFDPWGATQTAIYLAKEGVNMLEFRQGGKSYSEPCKKFEAEIAKRAIRHNGSPVMRWQVSNAVTKMDINENIMPDKQKSSDKIDGVVSSVMAYGVYIVDRMENPNPYENRGIRVIDVNDPDFQDEDEEWDGYDDD